MGWLRQHQRIFSESIARSADPTVGRRKVFFFFFWLAPDEYGYDRIRYGRTHRSAAQPSILGSPAELVQALTRETRNPNTISPRSSYW